MEKVGQFSDASQGPCLVRKDFVYAAPSTLDQWTPKYFVIGGAVAKANVLQVKQDTVVHFLLPRFEDFVLS